MNPAARAILAIFVEVVLFVMERPSFNSSQGFGELLPFADYCIITGPCDAKVSNVQHGQQCRPLKDVDVAEHSSLRRAASLPGEVKSRLAVTGADPCNEHARASL